MIFGASGTFKSFWMLDIALKLALADTSVLYIAAEDEYGYRPRLEAWLRHHRQAVPQHLTFVMGAVDLFDTDEMLEFSRAADAFQPKLIVVDTFAMCSGAADENSARDMKVIVDGCKLLTAALDCVVVVVHHTNALGKQERGSKFLRNACDTVIRISHGDDCIVVESQKTKSTAPFDPYYLKEVVVDLGYANNLGEAVSSLVLLPSEQVVRSAELTPHQRAVLEVLAVQPDAAPAQIVDVTEISQSTVYAILKRLEHLDLIRCEGNGRVLTPQGRASLVHSNDSNANVSIPEGADEGHDKMQDSNWNRWNQREFALEIGRSKPNHYQKEGRR